MEQPQERPITEILSRVHDAKPGSLDELITVVYPELRRIAGALMRGERDLHVLQPTALVSEFFLRVFGKRAPLFNDRRHFFLSAARAMRHVLVEYARQAGADKRGGGGTLVPLDEAAPAASLDGNGWIELSSAIDRLHEVDERAATVVELRFFAGLTQSETAAELGISTATVEREWEYARAWLYRALSGARGTG